MIPSRCSTKTATFLYSVISIPRFAASFSIEIALYFLHDSTHAAHKVHFAVSIIAFLSIICIALTAHERTQRLHPIHFSRSTFIPMSAHSYFTTPKSKMVDCNFPTNIDTSPLIFSPPVLRSGTNERNTCVGLPLRPSL